MIAIKNKGHLKYSLNHFYRVMGTSKQAVHQLEKRMNKKTELGENLIPVIEQIRKEHPTMAIRSMYVNIRPGGIGRDRFEKVVGDLGYRVQIRRNCARTTNSNGVIRFDNLIENLKVKHFNHVWVSDITYFELNGRFYYITFITDKYSRVVKGHSVAKTLRTEDTTIPALRMALKKNKPNPGLIFHSDGGGQYYSKEFLAITKQWSIQNSMGKVCYENPLAERMNGIIKNCYLHHWSIKNYEELVEKVDRAVKNYNTGKPHSSLGKLTPIEFEKTVYIYTRQTAEGDESQTAELATAGASSPLVAGQTASGSDVHPAELKKGQLKVE
jgi:transposase InsO family protein